jgi:hypothetical protein
LGNIVVRFPDGSREFRHPEEPLKEGDVIWHEGQPYRVLHVGTDHVGNPIATVEADSDDVGDLLDSERGGIVLVPAD